MMSRLMFITGLTLAVSFFYSHASLAQKNQPSAFCDQLLPVTTVENTFGEKATNIVRKPTNVIPESTTQCNRIYAENDFDRFSDELIVLVTTASSPAGAKSSLERIAREAKGSFGLSRPDQIGDSAVHFRRRDPLSDARMEFNVSFVVGKHLIELKYQSVDDGKDNKFVYESNELEKLAKKIERNLRTSS